MLLDSLRLLLGSFLCPDYLCPSLSLLQPIVHCTTLPHVLADAPRSRIRTTHRLIPPSSMEYYLTSISAGLEIEALIEIGVKVRLHARGKERLILGSWNDHVTCTRKRGIEIC